MTARIVHISTIDRELRWDGVGSSQRFVLRSALWLCFGCACPSGAQTPACPTPRGTPTNLKQRLERPGAQPVPEFPTMRLKCAPSQGTANQPRQPSWQLCGVQSSPLPSPPVSTFTSHEDSKNRDLGYIPLGGDSTKNSRRRVRFRHGSNCFFDEGNKFHDFEDTESSPDQYLETEIRVGTPLSFTGEGFQAST